MAAEVDHSPAAATHDTDDIGRYRVLTPDGILQTRTIAPDGTGIRVDSTADGTAGATWSIERQPDGSRVETRLVAQGDPSSAEITYEPTGRSILQEHDGDRAVETLTDPDGHTVRTTWTTSGGGLATMIERVETTPQQDGTVVQAVATTRGGPVTITVLAADGGLIASRGSASP